MTSFPQKALISQIQDWIQKGMQQPASFLKKIPGDASNRRYYRGKSKKPSSWILMKVEPFEDQKQNYPFLQIADLFRKSGIRVPKIYHIDEHFGFILEEDLGDDTLLKVLLKCDTQEEEDKAQTRFYQKCIDSMLQIQSIQPSQNIPAFSLRFDLAKLMWEVDFTLEHFFHHYLDYPLDFDLIQKVRVNLLQICSYLEDLPTVLTHRDYHCRNIMFQNSEITDPCLIDFQDARMGPRTYDLVSLLKDAYFSLSREKVEYLKNYYFEKIGSPQGFEKEFDWMCLQRTFKAMGSFAYFYNRNQNSKYLRFVGNAFENLREVLSKYPEFSPLKKALYQLYF